MNTLMFSIPSELAAVIFAMLKYEYLFVLPVINTSWLRLWKTVEQMLNRREIIEEYNTDGNMFYRYSFMFDGSEINSIMRCKRVDMGDDETRQTIRCIRSDMRSNIIISSQICTAAATLLPKLTPILLGQLLQERVGDPIIRIFLPEIHYEFIHGIYSDNRWLLQRFDIREYDASIKYYFDHDKIIRFLLDLSADIDEYIPTIIGTLLYKNDLYNSAHEMKHH